MNSVKKKTWHYKWYQYWLNNGRGIPEKYRENLCHYVRVLLFWAPVTWIDNHTNWDWGKVGAVGAILFIAGLILWGLTVLTINFPIEMSLAAGSFIALLLFLLMLVVAWRGAQGKDLGIERTIFEAIDTTKLVWNYAVAKKRKICPYIEFVD